MSEVVIKVENLSKRYTIRHQKIAEVTCLRHVIADIAAAPLRWLSARSAKRKAQGVSSNNGGLSSGASPLPLTASQLF